MTRAVSYNGSPRRETHKGSGRTLILLLGLALLTLILVPALSTACGCSQAYYDPPSEPQDLAIEVKTDSLKLQWEEPEYTGAGEVEYVVYKGTDPEMLEMVDNCVTDTNYTDGSVEVGIEYFYSVQAYSYGGSSALSETVNEKYVTLPSAPMNISAVCGKGFIEVLWDSPMDSCGDLNFTYNVYRAEQNDDLKKVAKEEGVPFHNSTGLDNHLEYSFQVTAVNKAGEGVFSEIVTASPMHKPSEPINVECVTGGGFVHLSWSKPTDVGGEPEIRYEVYKGLEGRPMALVNCEVYTANYNCTGLDNGLSYCFNIRAVNTVGAGDFSEKFTATPIGPCSEPVDVDIQYGNHFVHLRWSPPEEDGGEKELGYNVYKSTDNNNFILVAENIKDTDYNITELPNGKQHLFKVIPVNSNGEGESTPILTVVPIGPPSAPIRPKAMTGDRSIEVIWEEPMTTGGSETVEYLVQVIEVGGDLVKECIVRETHVNLTGLAGGEEYGITIAAFNCIGTGIAAETSAWFPKTIVVKEPEVVAETPDEVTPETTTTASPTVHRPWDHNLVPAALISAPVAVLAIAILLLVVNNEKKTSSRNKD